jgi:selenocysteine lyase/cysteine desulfurase
VTDWEEIRAEFPALANWTYLNTATFGQVPRRGVEAMSRHFARRDELACADFLAWFDDADRLRASIAQLIHCTAADVAFVPNASAALGILLGGIEWAPGDRIVTLRNEFPNDSYAPRLMCRVRDAHEDPGDSRGVELLETGREGLLDAIGGSTRLVAVSMLNYSDGYRPDLLAIARRCRQRGVLLYVDGTQGVGAVRFDAAEIRPSMLAVHAYKWMLAPNGAGFLYVDPDARRILRPNAVGWRSHRTWRDVDHLHHGKPELKDSAERYEGGGLPSALLYAMEAAVEMMLEIGAERIERRVLELAACVRTILRDAGAEVEDGATPIVAARFAGRDASTLARRLKEARVIVAARKGYLRVSPHFYNTETDLERLREALRGEMRQGS